MKAYVFQVELKPDEEGWRGFYPAWEDIGASTWGNTREEALQNIQEVLGMMIEEFVEEGRPISGTETLSVAEGAAVAAPMIEPGSPTRS